MTATAILDGRPVDADEPAVLGDLLARRLSTVFGEPLEIGELHELSGGASRQTWSFRTRPRTGETQRLVLRRDPPGYGRPEAMAREAAVLTAAARAGVPVPALVDASGDETVLGSPYVLTRHVDGETIARRLLREPEFARARAGMARRLGQVAAEIHRLPAESVPNLPYPDPLERLEADYEALGEPLPTLELGLRWLDANRPGSGGRVVVHGDFRNGNLIIDPDGLRAVLDWENVHGGDPLEDLGWLCVKCWRFASAQPVGGFGSRADLLDGYAEVAGTRPDPEAVRWWEVYGTARWTLGCRLQAQRHLSGETRSVELAAVGRRVCEQEHDLLLALGYPPPETPDPETVAGASAPRPGLHGRPTAAELATAVQEYLRAEVQPAGGRTGFHGRVAANVLGIIERELRLGPDQERVHRERLASLGMSGEAELASAIRSGAVDPRDPRLVEAIRADVTDRLLVANPKYLGHPA